MGPLRRALDRLAPRSGSQDRPEDPREPDALADSCLYTPGEVTRVAPHVRDALDHRRILSIVALALLPAALLRAWSVGQRLQLAAAAGQATGDWGSRVYAALPGAPFDPSALGCLVHGLLYYVPAVAVAALAGGAVEWAGATRRRRPLDESFALHALLVPLLLPPETPLGWVAAATALGAVVARELFGTAPRNLLHPALAAQLLALLALRAPLDGGPPQVLPDASWGQAFLGRGGAGGDAVAALWSLPGAALLLITRSASWRTMLGMALGTLAASLALGAPGGLGAAPRALPFQWHLVLGGWMFGAVFLATDPASSPASERSRLLYGAGIGALVVGLRGLAPRLAEPVTLAILVLNLAVPLFDRCALRAYARRRRARAATR
jgi:Na+-transporting NADH:ubiquinone oxidoreductase subunit B